MVPRPTTQTLNLVHQAWSRDASVHELGKRIAAHPTLANLVLRFVNSRHLELGREVSNPGRAVLLLGTKATGTLAVAQAWIEFMDQVSIDPAVKQALMEDCVLRASMACALSRRFANVGAETAFVLGLLAETGKVISMLRDPARTLWMDNIRCLTGEARLQKEREFLEKTHVEELVTLCRSWGLPKALTTPLIGHHEEEDADRPHRIRQLVGWADLLAEVVTSNDPPIAWTKACRTLVMSARFAPDIAEDVLATGLAAAQVTGEIVGVAMPDQPSIGALMNGEEEAPDDMGREALLRKVQQMQQERSTMKKQLDELKLRFQALQSSDTLTGLPARKRYFEVLRREVRRAQESGMAVTVVHIDIDSLERHNLRYGHAAGDAILKKVAEMLGRVTREKDFCARIGGDEFALIMPHTNPGGGRIIAERVRAAIEAVRLSVGSRQIQVSATVVGICLDEAPGLSAADLHNRAATKMQSQKGANRVAWAA